MTKEEHKKEADICDTRHIKYCAQYGKDYYGHDKQRDEHKKLSSKLDDKT